MRSLASSLLATLLLTAAPGAGRAQALLHTKDATVEIIGLHRWTAVMLQDSLAVHAPGQSITSHACAAVMHDALHFPDVSVVTYLDQPWSKVPFTDITVIEPEDSALVRYLPPFADTTTRRHDEWTPISLHLARHPEAMWFVLQHASMLLGDPVSADTLRKYAATSALRDLLAEQRTPRGYDAARRALREDGNAKEREAALLILAGDARSDTTWWAIARALRDPTPMVYGTALQLLRELSTAAPRRVDWRPALPSLRAVLDGTDLFAHDVLIQALVKTRVSPALAVPLLGGGGRLVLEKLGSHNPIVRRGAHALLVQLRGTDLGTSQAAWARWVASLPDIGAT